MQESKRVIGGRKAKQKTLELAEVRAQAYQFIREHPDITTADVAKRFNVDSTHACNWIKHCREGKQDRLTKTLSKGKDEIQEVRKETIELTFEQVSEAIIFAFEQAKLVPSLKEQIYRLENKLAATKNELENLRKYYQEKRDQAQRFRLAQRQGDIKGNAQLDF